MNFKKSIFCVIATFFFLANIASGVTLLWNPSPDTNVIGYNIYYGPGPRSYTNETAVGNVTNLTIPTGNFVTNTPYYFTATAYDAAGDESDFSNEILWTNSAGVTQTITFVGVEVDYGLSITALTSQRTLVMSVTNQPNYFYNESLVLTNNPVLGGTAP